MTAKLINDATGESLKLDEITVVGRSPGSAVVIADPRVSRRHALIRYQDDDFWFFDLGSSNGSSVNGKRVTMAQPLKNGDQVKIASHVFRFEVCGSATPGTEGIPPTEMTMIDVASRDAILLVSDIQGFTSLAEKLDPDQLAPIIGSWYAETARILEEHGATLDKFIGDSVLAYWLETSPQARQTALHTARSIQQSCEAVQEAHTEMLAKVGLDFRVGAALHLGPIACGGFGAQEFTLLGDAVNLTFRLEAMTRTLGERAVVSGDFLQGWSDGPGLCRSLGHHQVKGRAQPVEIFALQ